MKQTGETAQRDKVIIHVTERKVATERDKAIIQQNLFQSGALLTISIIIFQGLLSSFLSDTAEYVSVIALSVAIPLLAGCFLISWSEYHYEVFTLFWSAVVLLCSNVGMIAAFVGIGAIMWHLSVAAFWVFLGVSVFMLLIYGFYMSNEMQKALVGDPHYDNRRTLD